MPYLLNRAENTVFGTARFKNALGKTECVEFVRQTTSAPHTTTWHPGTRVMDAQPGSIPRGTAIATFNDQHRYPTDALGKHAAIYLGHGPGGIRVLDQWNAQGEVKERTIRTNSPTYPRNNQAMHYYVIEAAQP